MNLDLPFLFALFIAFAVFAYVVMDGFDLGVGILFPALDHKDDKTVAMNTIAPVWDGNETWLVAGGGGLFAAFPLAYAVLMPALYMPLIAMLLGLIFRGVAFEFRWRTERARPIWDAGFAIGSLVAAFAQGVALGAIVQGVTSRGRAYAGGPFDWLTPFSMLTGVALVAGYALLGAAWLVWKTEGDLQQRAKALGRIATVATIACLFAVSLWTPFLNETYRTRWFGWPGILQTAPVPITAAVLAYVLFTSFSNTRHDGHPFLAGLGLFLVAYIGLGISLYPNVVPPSITIADAAAPDTSLRFLAVGGSILVPIILVYTGYAYWVFRGKVRHGDGYH